jgi:hypothetical protein
MVVGRPGVTGAGTGGVGVDSTEIGSLRTGAVAGAGVGGAKLEAVSAFFCSDARRRRRDRGRSGKIMRSGGIGEGTNASAW